MPNPYLHVLRTPHALPMVASAFIGRLPLSMIGLGSVLLVQDYTGSYALGGGVAAAGAVATAISGRCWAGWPTASASGGCCCRCWPSSWWPGSASCSRCARAGRCGSCS